MPTASTTAEPTARQLSFFNTLAAERGIPTIEHFAPGTTRRGASEAIDGLLAMPRNPTTREQVNAGQQRQGRNDGEVLPTPSQSSRAGRMLLAGGVEATVTFADGRHCTVEIRTRGRRGRGWTNMGPGEEGARTNIKILGQKVGWINVENGYWKLTLRTRRDEYRQAVLAVFEYAATGECAGGERVQEASRCGRCFRPLTDPVSIDRGIGPECFGRDTGSQHIDAQRDRNGETREARAERLRRQAEGTTGAEADVAWRNAHGAQEAVEEARAYEREMQEEREMGWEPSIARRTTRRAPRREQTMDSLSAMADALTTPVPAATPAPAAPRGVTAREIAQAREIIAEALDLADMPTADSALALRVFDALKA